MPVQLMRAKFLAYLACLEDSAPYVARGLQASTGTTPEPCSTISATRTSSTPSDTPSFHPTGSATSGEIRLAPVAGTEWYGSVHLKTSLDVRAPDATPGKGGTFGF